MLTPRPVVWCSSLRCIGDDGLSARDQVLLEILVAGAQEVDPAFERASHEVPVSRLSELLPGVSRRAELEASLSRLATRNVAVSGPPKRRATRKKLKPGPTCVAATDDAAETAFGTIRDRLTAVVDALEAAGAPDEEIDSAAIEVTSEADAVQHAFEAREPLPEDASQGLDLLKEARHGWRIRRDAAVEDHVSPILRRWEVRLGLVRAVEASTVKPFENAGDHMPPVGVDVVCTPIVSYTIDKGVLRYELAGWLNRVLAGATTRDGRPGTYVHLDLSAAAAWRSRYTLPVYRYLASLSLERVLLRERVGNRPASDEGDGPRKQPARQIAGRRRIGRWSTTVDLMDLVKIADFPLQDGRGVRHLVEKKLLGPVLSDLRSCRVPFEIIGADVSSGRGIGISVTFRLRSIPIVKAMKARAFGSVSPMSSAQAVTLVRAEDAALGRARTKHDRSLIRAATKERLAQAITSESFDGLFGRDTAFWHVQPDTWLRIWNRWGMDEGDLRTVSHAWRLAVHEALNEDVEHFGDLTGIFGGRESPLPTRIDEAAVWLDLGPEGDDRDCRGRRLVRTVLEHGADVAAVLFAAEEVARPDLTDPGTLAALGHDGTVAYVEEVRHHRIEKAVVREGHLGHPFTRRTDGLLAVVREARENARSRPSPHMLDLEIEIRREERQILWNAERRAMRREAREARPDAAEAADQV